MTETWTQLLMRDHETTEKLFDAVEGMLGQPGGIASDVLAKAFAYLEVYVDACHNKKEEEHLFARAAERGIPRQGGPLAVMLAEHEQSRRLLATLKPMVAGFVAGVPTDLEILRSAFSEYASLLKNHFWKENDILYPMARRVFTPEDDADILAGIGAVEARLGADTRARYYELAAEVIRAAEVKDLSYNLDRDTLAALLNTLPVELSFVDADDVVRYFSHENGEKIFARTRGAIGRKVQNCHPPKSVHLVNRILAEFKAGKREVAEFWIDMNGRMVHIRYWPVRSPQGGYLGCLETVQDATPIRALQGQRRLLDETPPTGTEGAL